MRFICMSFVSAVFFHLREVNFRRYHKTDRGIEYSAWLFDVIFGFNRQRFFGA